MKKTLIFALIPMTLLMSACTFNLYNVEEQMPVDEGNTVVEPVVDEFEVMDNTNFQEYTHKYFSIVYPNTLFVKLGHQNRLEAYQ